MKKLSNLSQKGFTLIELLIVIALLGSLAVGLLAALDPFEQLKKGTDTSTRQIVTEMHGAIIRFFALKGNMPWCDPSDATVCTDPAGDTLTDINAGDNATSPYAAIEQIKDSGELKTNFVEAAATNMDKIFVTGSFLNATISVCYLPIAKSFQADQNTRYTASGVEEVAGTCKSDGGLQDCHWCLN